MPYPLHTEPTSRRSTVPGRVSAALVIGLSGLTLAGCGATANTARTVSAAHAVAVPPTVARTAPADRGSASVVPSVVTSTPVGRGANVRHAVAPAPSTSTAPPPAPVVAPLRTRISPDLLVLSANPLSAATIATIETLAKSDSALQVDAAPVILGRGKTEAIGVDPSTFRAYTPQGTAESDQLWQSVARGDVAVAHAVAKALDVPLGGRTTIGTGTPTSLRVGAYATTGLPGVGAVVDPSDAATLGLRRGAGLLLTTPGEDPVIAGAVLQQALGTGYRVTALRVPLTNGHLQWVAPAFGPITSPFGPRISPLHPAAADLHPGIDIGAPLGAPIYAAADGYVQYAGPASGFGNEVILTHAGGVTTVYGHMSKILVSSGPVTTGQPIALVGALGESTGPHLHFEVHVDDRLVDPLAWLAAHGVKVTS